MENAASQGSKEGGEEKEGNFYLIKGNRNKASVTNHFTFACVIVGLVLVKAQPIVNIPWGCIQINDLESGFISLKPSNSTSCG